MHKISKTTESQRKRVTVYKVTNKKFKNWDKYRRGEPLICLEDEYGGQSVIAIDDRCFVLYNGSDDRDFVAVKHWYAEAADALREFLNNNPKWKEER